MTGDIARGKTHIDDKTIVCVCVFVAIKMQDDNKYPYNQTKRRNAQGKLQICLQRNRSTAFYGNQSLYTLNICHGSVPHTNKLPSPLSSGINVVRIKPNK